jgi:hypothetical protein
VAIAAYCLIFPVISAGVLISSSPGFSRGCWAIAATVVYSPLYLRHISYFVRGLPLPSAGWSLATLTVLIVGTVPLAGGWWLTTSFALAVCLLTTLPWRRFPGSGELPDGWVYLLKARSALARQQAWPPGSKTHLPGNSLR